MRQLREDIAKVRREWRDARTRSRGEADAKGQWRPRWWNRLVVWGGAVLGVYLLVWGDTFERIIGAGLVAPALILIGISAWVYWKGVRLLRSQR
jgi:hypothetical protein